MTAKNAGVGEIVWSDAEDTKDDSIETPVWQMFAGHTITPATRDAINAIFDMPAIGKPASN